MKGTLPAIFLFWSLPFLLPGLAVAGDELGLEPLLLRPAPPAAASAAAPPAAAPSTAAPSGAASSALAQDEECEDHSAHGGGGGGRGEEGSGRESTHGAGGSGRGGGRPLLLESEHRPLPLRSYLFNQPRRQAEIRAYLRRPDGSLHEPELILGANPRVSFPTPMGDGPAHGPHNLYLVERGVEGERLVVRTAKWITMHHRCSWGHEGKFDPNLINPQPLAAIPFELVMDDLWSPNFHARVSSGDHLRIRVLSFGRPVAGARVTLTTEQGWSKTVVSDREGIATLQLIRDYYPALEFKRGYRGRFIVTARHDDSTPGTFKGLSYRQVSYLTSHPWAYSPPAGDYSSRLYGLLLATMVMIVGGGGVYLHRERRQKKYRGIVFDE